MFMDWKINMVKMSIPPKAMHRFNTIPIKIPMVFFAEIESPILKFVWTLKGPQIAKTTLRKNKAERHNFLISKLTIKLIEAAWCWQKDRHTGQWHRTEDPESRPLLHGQVVLTRCQDHSTGKGQSCQQMVQDNWTSTCK